MSSEITNNTKIYFNSETRVHKESPAPEKIGRIWQQMREAESEERLLSLLGRLGLGKRAVDEKIVAIVKRIIDHPESIAIEPIAAADVEKIGVFVLYDQGKPFAVFKMGEYRANSEIGLSEILRLVGLSDCATTGIFAAIQNPQLRGTETVRLYNGNLKVYLNQRSSEEDAVAALQEELLGRSGLLSLQGQLEDDFASDRKTVVGILEPYLIDSQKPITADHLFRAIAAMGLGGVKDLKRDAWLGKQFCDTEENMGEWVDPVDPETQMASTDMPILDQSVAGEPITKKTLEGLHTKFSQIDPYSLGKQLERYKLLFPDLSAERLSVDEVGLDQGNCDIAIRSRDVATEGARPIKLLDPSFSKSYRLYSDLAIGAFVTRLTRIKDFLARQVRKNRLPTCRELMYAIDPACHRQVQRLRETESPFARMPHGVVGRLSPDKWARRMSGDSELGLPASSESSRSGSSPPLLWRGKQEEKEGDSQ